jgi:hypothetical protein
MKIALPKTYTALFVAFTFSASIALFTGCDVKVSNPPSGDKTTVVNPPAEKNTTIVNPPKEEKKETTTSVTSPGGSVTEKTTETK